ncbi:MAG TPA: glycosyltransferase family A protein [Fimbriimonadaceae bacterium]|nr:glycosyltransferase family A protein [Fimbriimonadaceae bacterium]
MAGISACIAVYNGAQHLATAIRSVQAQTVPVDEILVLDDGSTDDSAAVAEGFDGVRMIRQPNGGIGAARRALVEHAKGDWIAFCDHDDWWEANRIEVEKPFTADPETVLIYSGVWHVDENGVETEYPLRTPQDAPSIDHVVPNPEDIWTSSTLLRRQAVLDAGNFNPAFRTGEDMLMWFQLGGRGKIVQIPQRLVHMSRRQGSTSAANRKQYEYAVALYDREVLPNLARWYPSLGEAKLQECRRLLEAKVGYTMALLAAHCERDGERQAALDLYRRARKLAPKSRGVLYRYVRSLMHLPVNP